MTKTTKTKIRYNVFLPSFILIICTILFSIINNNMFIEITTYAKNMMISQFGWLFSITGIICLISIIATYFSPIGNIRIGGENARPFMKKSSCVFIILCTTIAAGILFWGTSEPIYHLSSPPASLGIEPLSPQAAKYAMETMYLHWTFMPYAFYTVPAIVFAFAYYNMKRPFSIGSQISPLLKNRDQRRFDTIVDVVILFAISFAIASSFATSIMNVGGGLNELLNIANNKTLWIIIAVVGTIAFIASSGSGLFKGIKILSNINVYIYVIILLVLLLLGPSTYMLSSGTEAFGGFLTNLFDKALFTGSFANDPWPKDWTTFYWSNWMAWAPVTAIFLARLCYGYTLKEVIVINFVLPSLFSTAWMTILSGISINFQMNGVIDLVSIINEKGYGAATYAILEQFPLSKVLIAIYIFAVFISFVTATDSTVLPKTHKAPDSYINVSVDFGNSVGMIPLNSIVEKAEAYKPKQRITYKLIKEYILEKYSFKVHTAYIAEVKRDLGLPMYDAPNAVETLKQPRKHPTPIQITAIKDALTYFQVI